MPSPVGHTIAGFGGLILARYYPNKNLSIPLLLSAVVLSNLPDIDMLPGLVLFGEPGRFHRQATHSLIVAVAMGVIVGLLMAKGGRSKKREASQSRVNQIRLGGIWWGSWAAGLYALHILLDMMVADAIPPTGVQALWPFSQKYFYSPITVFSGFNYSDPNRSTLQTLLSLQNLVSVLREIVILVPCVGLIWFFLRSTFRSKTK